MHVSSIFLFVRERTGQIVWRTKQKRKLVSRIAQNSPVVLVAFDLRHAEHPNV